MNAEKFEDVLRTRLRLTEKTLEQKSDEYARGDMLNNIKRAADLLQCTPERALIGFVSKHIVALTVFVNDLEEGKEQSLDRWNEKLGDTINYMILLEALVIERKHPEQGCTDEARMPLGAN